MHLLAIGHFSVKVLRPVYFPVLWRRSLSRLLLSSEWIMHQLPAMNKFSKSETLLQRNHFLKSFIQFMASCRCSASHFINGHVSTGASTDTCPRTSDLTDTCVQLLPVSIGWEMRPSSCWRGRFPSMVALLLSANLLVEFTKAAGVSIQLFFPAKECFGDAL